MIPKTGGGTGGKKNNRKLNRQKKVILRDKQMITQF